MENKIKRLLIILTVIFVIIFSLLPFIYMITISLFSRPDFLQNSSGIAMTLNNYKSVLTDRSLHFIDFLKNSLIVSAVSAFLVVLIAGFAAYAITRLVMPGKELIMFLVLAVSMFPQISLISYLFKLMTNLGWINTFQGLVFPYIAWTLPLSLWILVSYFVKIPKEMDQAALVDGCSNWQVFFKVIIPVALPGLLSTALLAFIFAFNEFIFALMLTTDYHARTVPVGIALFQGLHGETPWGNIMAAATFSTIPLVAITIIFQRYIIQGLTRGAVKG
jgi:multiple sugar transport system permease protein